MRHQAEDGSLPVWTADLCSGEIQVEFVVVAVGVPFGLRQSEGAFPISGVVTR
jgi:hypothetical protein